MGQNRMAVFSSVVFLFIVLLCLLGPILFGQQKGADNDLANNFREPSAEHWFGTDDLGRDLFVRTLEGGRISLAVGFLATAVSLVIGVSYGSIAGYLGGRTDALLMRIVDILYSLPFTIFVILLMVMFGLNFILLFIAIGAVEWLTMSRIVRAQIMALKDTEFVEAARALGYGKLRIIFGHLLPNVLGTVIIYSSLTIPAVMLLEAVLSFLGLGIQPPMSSWGLLIKDGAEKIDVYPWLLLFPAIFFSLTLFSLNFIGDGLRDALDPKSSKD
jgi:oligopeptide transport system permease protein